MESLYYVMSWLCHRTCRHCYEDRFRPYHGAERESVIAQARANSAAIAANLPPRWSYLDRNDPLPDGGGFVEKPGRIVLAGGEILLPEIRESVLYPALGLLNQRYAGQGIRLIVQTTGDLLTRRIAQELLDHGVWMISVSGLDAFHAGWEQEGVRQAWAQRLRGMMEGLGMKPYAGAAVSASDPGARGPYFQFFGATPETWIGKLWPRGRAWRNGLSTATLTDNFCNGWSGGLGFLDYRYNGSEVSVDPEGNVFPCCLKTRKPLGNLLREPLEQILERLVGNPVYEAITMGHPERMGIAHGWTVERFLEKSAARLPDGRLYRNLCIGCDAFHDEVLGSAKLHAIEPPG